jgi:hypothetical protein
LLFPLFPLLFPDDPAMAVGFSDVDSSSVSAGGVTIANLPQVRDISDGLHSPHRGSVGFLGAAFLAPPYI